MRNLKLWRFALFVVFILLYIPHIALAALAGKISILEGRVDVLKSGKNVVSMVKAGDPVDIGDVYRAKSDGRAEIIFLNNNILKIAPNTRAEIQEAMFEGNKTSNIVKLHRGRVQAISSEEFIKKVSAFAESNKFEVHTPNAVAGIRGSNMVVSFMRGITSTLFIAGRGYQFNPNDPQKKIVTITGGNISFVATTTGSPSTPRKATTNEIAIQVSAVTTTDKPKEGEKPKDDKLKERQGNQQQVQGQGQQDQQQVQAQQVQGQGQQDQQQVQAQQVQGQQVQGQQDQQQVQAQQVQGQGQQGQGQQQRQAQQVQVQGQQGQGQGQQQRQGPAGNPGAAPQLTPTPTPTLTTDTLGNVSITTNYMWTADYTSPVLSLSSSASPVTGSNTTTNVTVKFSSSKQATYSYSLNGGAWTSTGAILLLSGLAEGSYTLDTKATDLAGNVSTTTTSSFDLKRYTLTGNISGTGSTLSGTATGDVAGVINQNWGGSTISSSGSYLGASSTSWQTQSGGQDKDSANTLNGYWFDTASGTYTGNSMNGTSNLSLITKTTLGTGTGMLTGSHTVNTFNLTDTGASFTETPLKSINVIDGGLSYFNGATSPNDGDLGPAYMGGTSSLWTATQETPANITAIGQYAPLGANPVYVWESDIRSYNYTNNTNTTYDGGAYWGYIKGIDNSSSLEGKLAAIYINPSGKAGYLKGSLTGMGYPDINMLQMTGSLYPTQMATAAEIGHISPSALSAKISEATYNTDVILGFSGLFTGGGTINIGSVRDGGHVYAAGITGQDWGIWKSYIGSTYAGTISDTWQMSMDFALPVTPSWTSIIGTEITGSKWSDDKITGLSTGYGADIQATPKTWINTGETLGTFKPANFTLQISSIGPWIETNKLLDMASTEAGRAKLNQLNIPCVQVGSVNLTGSALYNGGMQTLTVNMNDTKFFATTSGGPAKIWASGSTEGSWTTYRGHNLTPPAGITANISGGTLSADFTVKTFDTTSDKWLATVTNGAGGFGGSTTFRGAAAGTIKTGPKTFSGTAAGVAK